MYLPLLHYGDGYFPSRQHEPNVALISRSQSLICADARLDTDFLSKYLDATYASDVPSHLLYD
jgi:hypothetical protein